MRREGSGSVRGIENGIYYFSRSPKFTYSVTNTHYGVGLLGTVGETIFGMLKYRSRIRMQDAARKRLYSASNKSQDPLLSHSIQPVTLMKDAVTPCSKQNVKTFTQRNTREDLSIMRILIRRALGFSLSCEDYRNDLTLFSSGARPR